MFEQLFTYRGVLSRHREAPLVAERERYLATRAAVGLAPATLQNLAQALYIIAHTLELPADGPLDTTAINLAANRWVQSQLHGQHVLGRQGSRRRFIRVATEWLRFLSRLDEPEEGVAPLTSLVEAFATCMRHERGLSSKTISKYTWFVRQFGQWFSVQERPFSDVRVGDVDPEDIHLLLHGTRLLWLNGFTDLLELIVTHCRRSAQGRVHFITTRWKRTQDMYMIRADSSSSIVICTAPQYRLTDP
jgi:hypothetical protein